MSTQDRTNGVKIRAVKDADRLAVQSTHQSTFFLTGSKWGGLVHRWHEVGLAAKELLVLRPYGAAPVIELEGLGGPHGVLIVERSRGATRTLRNGSRLRLELGLDESVVLRTEQFQTPTGERPGFA